MLVVYQRRRSPLFAVFYIGMPKNIFRKSVFTIASQSVWKFRVQVPDVTSEDICRKLTIKEKRKGNCSMDYRHEIKHIISPSDAVNIRNNLRAVAGLDSHAKEKGCYRIRSLYFDDISNTALHEKLDGVNERKKYRIRYYDDDLSYIVLECKIKRDNVGCKPQEVLSLEETRKILKGDIAWMISSGKPLLAALYVDMRLRGLRPNVVVEYERVPYVYAPGNVRVTIDWNIRTGKPDQFLRPDGLMIQAEENNMLLEVKWDHYLPDVIRRAIALKGRHATAFSKYAACRVYF